MQIIKLPHNCSAYYMHQVSEMDNIKEQTSALITRDVQLGQFQKRISAIFATTIKRNKVIMQQFAAAGFRVVATYKSWQHGNRDVVMLFRRVTQHEFKTGKAFFKETVRGKTKAVRRRG